jgi:hypothetical protein
MDDNRKYRLGGALWAAAIFVVVFPLAWFVAVLSRPAQRGYLFFENKWFSTYLENPAFWHVAGVVVGLFVASAAARWYLKKNR